MHIVLIILLVVLFGYSLMLVLVNNSEVAVNLLFSQVPVMNLGLLLITSLALGMVIGMLLALIVFRVFQNRLEINRLKKEITALNAKLSEAAVVIEQHRANHLLSDTHSYPTDEQVTLSKTQFSRV